MQAFIEDYIEWVREQLGDPGRSKRLTPESVLRDLHAEHMVVFEELLKASAQETIIGYTEAIITLRNDTEFYSFPGNFRQFMGLERRLVDNPRSVVDRLGTKPFGSTDRGITISSVQRGFKVTRVPIIAEESQEWTLMYQKQPIVLHWSSDGQALNSLLVKMPASIPAEQGQIIRSSNYYVGELLHVIGDADSNQSVEVTNYVPAAGVLTLREPLVASSPSAKIKYEFRTFLPRGLDKLIATSVALGKTSDRTDPVKHRMLIRERRKFLRAARNYFRTATQDRVPAIRGRGRQTVDPMAL